MSGLADFLMRNRLDALEEKPEYTTADVNALMPKPAWQSPLAGLGSYQWSREAGAEPNWFGKNVLSNVPPEAMHAANFLVPGAKGLPRISNPIKAYHGSPHDFDKFDLSKIGTGEGAQAYGHGLYFAEREGVARSYRDTLGSFERPEAVPKDVWDALDRTMANYYSRLPTAEERRSTALRLLEPARSGYRNDWEMKTGAAPLSSSETRRRVGALEWLAANPHVELQPPGRMYEVALHATPEQFLDWDKPLSAQSAQVKTALSEIGIGPDLYENRSLLRKALTRDPTGEDALVALSRQEDPDTTSKMLARRSVPGTRYLDQGSRGAGQGTSNYVVWDDRLIEILRKYGLAPAVAAPSLAAVLQDQKSQ